MSTKKTLTNETLCERFENPFMLVKYAIAMARQRILRGEELDSNPANDVLDEIAEGRDENYKETEEETAEE